MRTGLAPLFVVLSVTLSGCSSAPDAPSALDRPRVSRVDIVGPAEIAPGGTAAFRAVLQFADGTSRDVTDSADWMSHHPAVLAVTAPGMVSGLEHGDGVVGVSADGYRAYWPIVVLPPDTYRLTVRVHDAEQPGLNVDAAITVTNEDGTVLPSVGNRFYGARGRVQLHISPGPFYRPSDQTLEVVAHQTADILLESTEPVELSGNYALVVTASPSCDALPPDARAPRTFAASIEQRRLGYLAITVAASGAVGVTQSLIHGQVLDSARVSINLEEPEPWWNDSPGIIQRLPSTDEVFAAKGRVDATIADGQIFGLLQGVVQVVSAMDFSRVASCAASDHGFTLTQQAVGP